MRRHGLVYASSCIAVVRQKVRPTTAWTTTATTSCTGAPSHPVHAGRLFVVLPVMFIVCARSAAIKVATEKARPRATRVVQRRASTSKCCATRRHARSSLSWPRLRKGAGGTTSSPRHARVKINAVGLRVVSSSRTNSSWEKWPTRNLCHQCYCHRLRRLLPSKTKTKICLRNLMQMHRRSAFDDKVSSGK